MRGWAATSLSFLAACTFKPVSPIQPAPEVIATEKFEQVINDAADILFVVDNSGSMGEEQFNMMANIAAFVKIMEDTGANINFAAVTTDSDLNPEGLFVGQAIGNVNVPLDTVNGSGQLVRDIPNAFCDGVIANSQNGVLNPQDPVLNNFIDNFGLIDDFTGREIGVFQDSNGDKIADNLITAEFADAVGCLIANGVRGSGSEDGLCQAVAALDPASLSAGNAAFLADPDSVLAIVVLGDEDDCARSFTEQGGEFLCQSVTLNNNSGSLKCSLTDANICGTGDAGDFNNLVPVNIFADRIKALRGGNEDKIFIATIAGPPGPAIADCGNRLPVPTCFANGSGSASPGNRFFQFASLFKNKIDSIEAPICGNFSDIIAQIGADLGQLLNAGCLNAKIDANNFDVTKDLQVKMDITGAIDVASCADIVSGGQQATTAEGNVCTVKNEFLDVSANGSCAAGFQVSFLGFTPPTGALVTIEYLSDPS